METKKCSICKEEKPLDDFTRDKTQGDGKDRKCRECKNKRLGEWRDNNRDQVNKGARQWRKENPGKKRGYALKYNYGITSEDYDRILSSQSGMCAICKGLIPGGRWDRFHVDHDHATGEVRGLLCTNCNRGLGYLQENPGILASALSYLSSRKNQKE